MSLLSKYFVMPAKSKKQQRFFGMVHRCQKTGNCSSPEVKKVATSISYDDADDFASTKHDKLPEKVNEQRFRRFKEFFMIENKNCQCDCNGCKNGECSNCSCDNCKCKNCDCH